MKKLSIVLFLALVNVAFSQNGNISSEISEIKLGEENSYLYKPGNETVIPEGAKVNFVYEKSSLLSVPLVKKDNNYKFSMKVPDSVRVVVMTVVDKDNKVLDNNELNGYVVKLKNRTLEEIEKTELAYLKTWQFANYYLKLKIAPAEIVKKYESLFSKNPDLKESEMRSYGSYMYLKYNMDKEKGKPEIIAYADQLSVKTDEYSLRGAFEYYSMLKMTGKSELIRNKLMENFPKGEFAKRNYMTEFYRYEDKTEEYILNAMKEYSIKFDDHSDKSRDQFYTFMLRFCLEKMDVEKLMKYEQLMMDKSRLSGLYNSHAWKMSGQNLSSPGSDLEFAEKISKNSLTFVQDAIDNAKTEVEKKRFQGRYFMYADTYALVLYKLKRYQEAFAYQHALKDQNALSVGGKERYAFMAEKATGPAFAKVYIEEELSNGFNSKLMIGQLRAIYKKLDLPESEYDKIKEYEKVAREKYREELVEIYGDYMAKDFTLTNLEGKDLKLSDFKGKVVVLDFWATWCGPCRASFPKMQELVETYKNEDVEFLFINTWERNKPDEIKKNVAKFLEDNEYSFNVLFDFKGDITSSYKVKGIPTKIVIDKNGEIISVKSSDDNLIAIIEENIK